MNAKRKVWGLILYCASANSNVKCSGTGSDRDLCRVAFFCGETS